MSYGMKEVTFSYPARPILHAVSFSLPPCGAVSLSGPSGCGKTTVLHLLAGLLTPQSGTVSVPEEIAVVFQEDRLLPWLTVRQNVAAVLPKSADARAAESLAAVGLTAVADAFPDTLSGGMKRRVAIARALLADFDILFLDEPYKGLDAETKRAVQGAVGEYTRNKTVVLVTHDPAEAEGYRLVEMKPIV